MRRSLIIAVLCLTGAVLGFTAPTQVQYWYLWGGNESQLMKSMVQKFNASQTQYQVTPLEVPDMQKILVAISSGSGPDVTDDFASNVAGYASKGILEPLDPYIARTQYGTSDFVPSALQTCQYQGTTYALPLNMNFFMLFYNKALFRQAGIAAAPKTDKELLDDAIKLTKVNSDGTLDTLGFPDFPIVYYLNNMTFAFGGRYLSPDGKTLTPDNAGTLRALNLIVSYRQKFGVDPVAKFSTAGGYLQPTDPFIAGKQAMRIDGPWFGNVVRNQLKMTTAQLDYGVAPLPYPDGHPELALGGQVDSSILYIPASAANKDGAWAFLSWMLNDKNMIDVDAGMGNFPSRMSALGADAFAKTPDFQAFASLVKSSKNLGVFPAFAGQAEFGKLLSDQAEKVWNLKMSATDAMAEAKAKAQALLNQ
ncbi:MAG TPA: ABC transporter substrate-binding protein [Spirochaetia bacterium]|nr:ABC transporter substrate-binding protein [Spirochaetia bacterium]